MNILNLPLKRAAMSFLTEFETVAYDDNDLEHKVIVTYQWIPPRSATYWEPAEGGVELESVSCDTLKLTQSQIDTAEQACIDNAWDTYNNRHYECE